MRYSGQCLFLSSADTQLCFDSDRICKLAGVPPFRNSFLASDALADFSQICMSSGRRPRRKGAKRRPTASCTTSRRRPQP